MIKHYFRIFTILLFVAVLDGCKLDAPVYPANATKIATGTGTTGTGTTGTGTSGTGTTGTGTTGTGTTGTGTTGTGTTGTGTTGTGTTGTGTTGTGTTGTGTTSTTTSTVNDGSGLPIPTFIGVQVQIDGGAIQKFAATSTFSANAPGSLLATFSPTGVSYIIASAKFASTDPADVFSLSYNNYKIGTYDITLIVAGNYSATQTAPDPAPGSVKVTSLTSTNIKGTFKVDLTDASGTVHKNAIGSFNVNP